MKTRTLLIALTITLAPIACAEIDYHVQVMPDQDRIQVEMDIPAKGPFSVQIGNWMPGSYSYGNFYESVHDVTAKFSGGNALNVSHPDNNTWTVDATGDGHVLVDYWVPTRGQRRFARSNDNSYVQISGPATYMYVVGRKKENCKISFEAPKNWPIVLGLDAAREGNNTYVAPNYDTLADNPVSTGDIIVDQYNLRGRDHYIVLEGANKGDVDQQNLIKDCRFVSAAETDFWGSVPYHKYVWHFIVYPGKDGGGGLEHLSSTQISLASGVGPGTQSVLSHEFFHLWNVKRSRPFVLGPFDYLTLPKTGNLWWYEGVTDYYANLLPFRYEEWNRDQFFNVAIRNLQAVRTNPARLQISPYQASYRVGDANGGRGNSNGYQISYYNLGWLAGMCLDIEIRNQTHNKHSLDDVARALYNECKDGRPGIQEDEIRKQCVKIGGPELGPFYDKVIMSPGELPVEEQLAKAGLKIQESQEQFVDAGFRPAFGFGGGGIRVSGVHGAAQDVLKDGDVIESVNGKTLSDPMSARSIMEPITAPQAGVAIQLVVKRDGADVPVTVTPFESTRPKREIVEDPAATADEVALRNAWLYQKLPAVQ